jgi:hypothetical protein
MLPIVLIDGRAYRFVEIYLWSYDSNSINRWQGCLRKICLSEIITDLNSAGPERLWVDRIGGHFEA